MFVLTDDHAAHAISSYGSVVNVTPRIDEIGDDELRNVYGDPAYTEVREELKAMMWREQARLGDAPDHSQATPPGCDDVEIAARPDIPRIRWLNPGPMTGCVAPAVVGVEAGARRFDPR